MSTQHPDLFAALAAPFDPSELKSRSQSGRQVHYVTARTVMNRLDTVLGPENWWDEYKSISDNSILCTLTIRLPDGSTLAKADAGGFAGMADSGDDDKSAFSDALKRAAVKFGVSRYLYGDGVPSFGSARPPAPTPAPSPSSSPATNGHGKWANGRAATNGHSTRPINGHDKAPTSGKALFGWCKDQEQRYSVGILKYLNSWAKLQDFPGRIVDWDTEQVALAHAEACRKLQSIQTSASDSYEEARN